jgi:predicted nuclease of predicted toxin-antitoxin system
LKFKIDENLPAECVKLFAEAGFPADTVEEEHVSGSEDVVHFARCVLEERILVTLDLDFANIPAYPPGSHAGIVVLRSKSQDKRALLGHLSRSWQSLLRGLRQINCGLSSGTE